MDLIDQIKEISQQVLKLQDQIQNEQATKTAFILPFIKALGFDVFNPTEVHPEFTADTPGVNNDKVDYAIIIDDKPCILIECKHCQENLDHPKYTKQLHKYFHVTEAKIGILTNGIIYRFFTDTDKPNVMDNKPFFEFNMLGFEESAINELKRFSKTRFNSNELEDIAKNLLYTKEIKRLFSEQLISPSSEFIKFFASQVYSGRMTSNVVEQFSEIVKRSLKEFINEKITDRLKTAIADTPESDQVEQLSVQPSEPELEEGIITTEEELQSYYIVKSILREIIDSERIKYKDTKGYFGINVDGKVKKTICRLRLDGNKKTIGVLTVEGKEFKKEIKSIDEIYSISSLIKDRLNYLTQNESQMAHPLEENVA